MKPPFPWPRTRPTEQQVGETDSVPLVLQPITPMAEQGRPSFQALQHRTVKRSSVVFYAFDLLHMAQRNLLTEPLRERRRALHRLTFSAPILLSAPLPGGRID